MCQRNHRLALNIWNAVNSCRSLGRRCGITMSSKVDPRCTVEALKTKFLQAGKDMCTILEWANTQDVAIKDAESIRLAQRVFDENYERDEQGEYQQTRAQPTERCIIRTSLRLNGVQVHHQGQNLGGLQNTGGGDGTGGTPGDGSPTQNFLTAIVTQNASESDKPGMAIVLSEQANMGLEAPGPVCRWRVRVRAVAPRSSRRYP